jgi:Right handed beta helix region
MRRLLSGTDLPNGQGRHAHRDVTDEDSPRFDEDGPRFEWRLPEIDRRHLWPIVWALVVCIAGTLIGLRGPQWLGLDNSSAKLAPTHVSAAGPASPPARICGNSAILGGGPAAPPQGAVTVPPGNDSGVNWSRAGATYWFAPGTHTLGAGTFTQIIPASGTKFIGAPGAVLDGKRINSYAFGGPAAHVTISYLTVRDFGAVGGNENQGVVNHNSASWWTIDHSTITGNAGAGVMLGRHNVLTYDCLKSNEQYGFNAYSPTGPARLVVEHNEIDHNDTYNWEKHITGCGCTGGAKFWDVNEAVIKDNWIHDNLSVGLWADTNNKNFLVENNYISDNYGSGVVYEISYNALIKDNTFIRDGLVSGPTNPGFPTGAIYISESGADSRVLGRFGRVLEITGNTFTNNWGGVVLWENANRFCNSPANTSTDYCTLVDKSVITLSSCSRANIIHQPYYGSCRWKTQNVLIDHNVFNFDPRKMGPSCTAKKFCGFQGLFSEYGSYPSWSPYKGSTVENHITFDQNNHFKSNTYNGPWRFMIRQQDTIVSWEMWQGSPYDQDAGSTLVAGGN